MKRLTLLSLWLLIGICPSTRSFAALSDFDDSSLWTPITDGLSPAALDIVHKGFTLSVPTVEPYPWTAGYKTAFALRGDFTFDSDFLLEDWPPGNHVRIGINFLIPSQGAIERTSEGWGEHEAYIFDGVGQGIVVNADTYGTLRLTRSGTTLSGYYLDHTTKQWVFVGSGPVTTADAILALIAWPDYTGGGQVKVTFENPVLRTPQYEPVPEPSTVIAGALLLLPFGVQAIRNFRNRKA